MQNSAVHLIEAGADVFNRGDARVGLAAITTKPMCISQHLIARVCGRSILKSLVPAAVTGEIDVHQHGKEAG